MSNVSWQVKTRIKVTTEEDRSIGTPVLFHLHVIHGAEICGIVADMDKKQYSGEYFMTSS